MSKHSRVSVSVCPLLWLAPLPFVLAMCLPLELPGNPTEPPHIDRVAAAPAAAQAIEPAASAPAAAR
ncbi:MAG TPA: hypothetical protein VFU71_16675 [Burkholderiaceae bacterium]|nr:hypothetical protein [Burkholderiaceae bacterium]